MTWRSSEKRSVTAARKGNGEWGRLQNRGREGGVEEGSKWGGGLPSSSHTSRPRPCPCKHTHTPFPHLCRSGGSRP